MAKGENIFKRKDGRWEARYVKGYELSGKIKYGFCYGKTYREAKDKVTAAKSALLNGKTIPAGDTRHRLSFYCDEWLRGTKMKVKESTYVKYEGILKNYIKPKLGGCFPKGINTRLIEDFKWELLDEELSPKTVKDILVVLRSILKFVEKQIPGVFSQIEIVYPKEVKKEMRVLSREEQICFVHYLLEDMDNCKFGILLALSSGLRIGELCALQWGDVSLQEHTIHIHATMQRLRDTSDFGETKTRIVIGMPKSDTSIRIIPMTEQLEKLCMRQYISNSNAYVLTGTENFMEPRTLQYRLKKYARACALEDMHFHTLRHTFATRCIEVGFEIKSLSEILGHSTTGITLDRYVHSSIELKRHNMAKLTAVEM